MPESPDIQTLVERYLARPTPVHREAAVLAGVPLVRSIIGKLPRPDHPLASVEDLESAGLVGLIEALDTYDVDRGVRFLSYAYLRVRGAVVDYLRSLDVLSADKRKQIYEAAEAAEAIRQATGAEPSDRDVAARLGIPVSAYDALMVEAQARFALSLDSPVGADDGDALASFLEDASGTEGFRAVEQQHLMDLVQRAIEKLPARSRAMLGLYYDEGLTLREISVVFKVSEARVSQILGKTMLTLRQCLEPTTAP